jgi:hypothetical protein
MRGPVALFLRSSLIAASPGERLINPIARHPGESRDPVTFAQRNEMQRRWQTRRFLRLALRAIGFADVRFGILPSQSGYRFAIPG